MSFSNYSRILNEKTVSLLRNLNKSNRANLFTTHKLTQDLKIDDEDAFIEMENPYKKEKRLCILCKYDIEPDYKNVRFLSQFQSRFTGRIYGRHITGLCKAKQEKVEKEIKKAQYCGFMGIYTKEVKYANDPKLFDIENPFKPHKYSL